jgi:hypothetical protein
MAKTKSTKCTNAGCVPEKLVKAAIREWNKEQRRVKSLVLAADGFTSYVSMVPAPPPPGTAVYYQCINSWMMAMMKASQLDNLYKQEAQLKAQRLAGEGDLTTLIDSYVSCASGFPV